MALDNSKIAFIGGGNMAAAIVGGLIARGFDKTRIAVSEPWVVNRDKITATYGVRTTASNPDACVEADMVVLAIKPQVARAVCEELGAAWSSKTAAVPLVVSVAAGITVASLQGWLSAGAGGKTPPPHVVRVMPNTPALVGEGASGLFAGGEVSEAEKALATALVGSVSKAAEWVDREELLDVVTGLSGSGPAYFFAFVEHLITSGTKLGLPIEQATRLAKQTCFGAGKMLLESSEEPAQLRKNVTSPNGTTQAALESLEISGFEEIVIKAVAAATTRAGQLGSTLGK